MAPAPSEAAPVEEPSEEPEADEEAPAGNVITVNGPIIVKDFANDLELSNHRILPMGFFHKLVMSH